MTNTIFNFLQAIVTFLNELLVEPAKAMFGFASEYLGSTEQSAVSFIGFFIVLFVITILVVLLTILVRVCVSHAIFLYKEKKRAKIRAIKKRERERTRAYIASNMEFDDMYCMYATED